MENTKEKILSQALRLFSEYGYEAVSVDRISKAVGIKAPSLYKHYKSKQSIFDAIFDEMKKRYDAQTELMSIHIANPPQDDGRYSKISTEALVSQVQELIRYSLHDEYVSRFRRMMTIEQFRSPEISALYTERYVNRILEYHEKLFEGLVAAGVLKGENTHSMALQYVSPVLLLLSICDRQPEFEEKAMKEIENHVRQFQAVYKKEI